MASGELVAIVSKMIHDSLLDRVTTKELAKEILAKVEPIIRDNQRGFDIRQQIAERDDFRAQLRALPVHWQALGEVWVRRDDVLALLDGSINAATD